MKKVFLILIMILSVPIYSVDNFDFQIARLHYDGGGDWYSNPTSLPNLLKALRERIGLAVPDKDFAVKLEDEEFTKYPMLYMTGHGNVSFSHAQAEILRNYLTKGGFLWADDNYGMDHSFRREMNRIFPDNPLTELPFSHPIFKSFYVFQSGLPKIHEHDGGPPKAYGIFINGRLCVLYTYETDIGDGLESPEVHNDPPEIREQALQMAINIIMYCLNN